jgi:DNA helicase II / ATP-dependent DNA helicase PcrA
VAADTLTSRQQEIVDLEGNCFVEACPGAGKTRTMVSLYMKVSLSLPPRHGAAALSYTNCAADEIRARCLKAARADLCGYPHFVGTFDSFIAKFLVIPFGSRWADGATKVRVLDAWKSIGLTVLVTSTKGKRMPVPMDAFPLNGEGVIGIDLGRVPYPFRAGVKAQQRQAIERAKTIRDRQWKRGYLSCDDARVCAALRLRDSRGASILSALAARFRTLIVDEAQDCSPIDLEILGRLRDAGIRIVAVADPNQAIFRFRGAYAEALTTFAASMKALPLEENFRSSHIICQLASSLRRSASTDKAVGRHAGDQAPIVLMPYEGIVGPELGRTFTETLSRFEISELNSVVLAHQLATSLRATGRPVPPREGASMAWRLADAVVRFRIAGVDHKTLLPAVGVVERMLLWRLGVATEDMTPDHAAEEKAIEIRWLRTEALRLLGALARVPLEDKPASRWIEVARGLLDTILPPLNRSFLRTAKQTLPDLATFSLPPNAESTSQAPTAATVHSVKGREYDAVMAVLPVDQRTEAVVNAWEQRADDEARAVLYVAATRPRRLLALAMPAPLLERVQVLAARDGAPLEIVAVPSEQPT